MTKKDKANMTTFKADDVPYLSRDHLNSYCNVNIVSKDGEVVRVNAVLLAVFSPSLFRVLSSAFESMEDSFTIVTDLCKSDVELVVNFVTEGLLPKPFEELQKNGGSDEVSEIRKVFQAFGIGFESSYPLQHVLKPEDVKVEFMDERALDDLLNHHGGDSLFDKHHFLKDFDDNNGDEFSKRRKRGRPRGRPSQHRDFSEEDEENEEWSPRKSKKSKKSRSSHFESIDVKPDFDYGDDEEQEEQDYKDILGSSGEKPSIAEQLKTYSTLSQRRMERAKELYKDQILVVIPDLSLEEFDKFVLPQSISSYLAEPLDPSPDMLPNTGRKGRREKEFSCDACFKQFTSKINFAEHVTKNHRQHYQCTNCFKAFAIGDEDAFRIHMFKHEQIDKIQQKHECIHCGFSSLKLQNVKDHVVRQGPYHNNKCPVCSETFFNYKDFKSHMDFDHYMEKRIICGLCPDTFKLHEEYLTHRRNVHHRGGQVVVDDDIKLAKIKTLTTERVVCDICGVEVSKKCYAKHYEAKHSDKPKPIPVADPDDVPTPCPQCQRIQKNREAMKRHIQRIHETFPCDVCGIILNKKSKLRHMKMKHMDAKDLKFKCSECGKGFIDGTNLRQHMNTHTNERPHVCQHCGQGFNSQGNLRMHIRGTHLGIKRTK